MIKHISWEEILKIWEKDLWPNRNSPIEPNSAMCFLKGYNMENMATTPTFFGFIKDKKLVGVNSGHICSDSSYRSRGLWVNPDFRNQGIGTLLLKETVLQAEKEMAEFVWSYPRKSSWSTYANAGFDLASNWEKSETSDSNAYCIKFV